jgi:hypothetical protein
MLSLSGNLQMRSGLRSMMVAIALLVCEHAHGGETAGELLNNCRSLEKGKSGSGHLILIPKTKEALVCWGYFQAMQNLSVWVNENGVRILGACPPERITQLELIHSFLKYARQHPAERKSDAALVVTRAFQEAFPCEQAVSPPG